MKSDVFWNVVTGLLISLLTAAISAGVVRMIRHARKTLKKTTFPTVKWTDCLTKEAEKRWEEIDNLWQAKADRPGKLLRPKREDPSFPILGSVVRVNGEHVLILPSYFSTGEDSDDIEGIGRTELILELLDVHLPYARIMGLKPNEVVSVIPDIILSYIKPSPAFAALVSSDMAFMTLSDKVPTIIPLEGEVFSFAWDLARHFFRISQFDYKKGAHRKEENRVFLRRIFEAIPASFVTSLYCSADKFAGCIKIDKIVIIKRIIDEYRNPHVELLSGKNKWKELQYALLVPLKHGSTFWNTFDKEKYRQCIDTFCSRMQKTGGEIPVYHITYFWPFLTVPLFIYHEIAEIIRNTSKNMDFATRPVSVPKNLVLEGISQHNACLFNILSEATELVLVARSHEKVLRDPCFWKMLARARDRHPICTFVMLDPQFADSLAETYRDKEPGFLQKEISSNLKAIERLSKIIGSELTVKAYLTKESPIFRVSLVDNKFVIFTGYQPEQRTDEKTRFVKLSLSDCDSVIKAMKSYIDKLLSQSTLVFSAP